MQGCSESEEREDIHGESSICAWGEVSLLGRLQEHKCVQSHLRLEHEFSTNPLQSLRLQLQQGVTWALAGIQLGSTAQHIHQL